VSERIEDGGYVAIRRSGKDKLSNHTKLAEDNWSIGSKKKLKVSMRHKMKKIFVGILDVLDKEKLSGNIDEDTHKRVRSRVLNIGNEQIRNMELELDARYNVEALAYHVEFKVVGDNYPGKED
jgi:hypothetical protein